MKKFEIERKINTEKFNQSPLYNSIIRSLLSGVDEIQLIEELVNMVESNQQLLQKLYEHKPIQIIIQNTEGLIPDNCNNALEIAKELLFHGKKK